MTKPEMGPETGAGRLTHYLLSLPERVLRSASGLMGGLLREVGHVSIPSAVRRTRLYENLVESTLRFLVEQVGQVDGVYPAESRLADDFAMRRAAGNGVEIMGILAFRASPVWVMAALADLTGAGRHLIREIAEALKKEGLLDPETQFESVDQMLDGLERSSSHIAAAINTPPLNVAELRKEWSAIREEVAAVPFPTLPNIDSVERLWADLQKEAAAQQRSTFAVSSLIALEAMRNAPGQLRWFSRSAQSAARRTGQLVGASVLGHYREALDDMHRTGFVNFWIREYRPYLSAAAAQFSPDRVTHTDRILRR
ncbi:MAG: hypothetical protein JJE04_12280 [Acidobacteriia bacterium]|nr:hypothetical protein [Terriglobia bacterium]